MHSGEQTIKIISLHRKNVFLTVHLTMNFEIEIAYIVCLRLSVNNIVQVAIAINWFLVPQSAGSCCWNGKGAIEVSVSLVTPQRTHSKAHLHFVAFSTPGNKDTYYYQTAVISDL